MASKQNVLPATVREWAKSPEGQTAIREFNATPEGERSPVTLYVGERGRLNPGQRAVYVAQHKNVQVVPNEKEPLREFKHKAKDKRGRTITKTAKMTLSEARALIGDTGKGRLDTAAVVSALAVANGIVPEVSEVEKPEGAVEKS